MSKKGKKAKKLLRKSMQVTLPVSKSAHPVRLPSAPTVVSEERAEQILPDDLVVVPDGTVVPENPGCKVYVMKHLKEPSIIKHGYINMSNLNKINVRSILNWVFGRESKPGVNQEVALASAKEEFMSLEEAIGIDQSIAESETTDVSKDLTARSTSLVGNGTLEVPRFLRHVRPFYLHLKPKDGKFNLAQEVDPKGGFTAMIELYPAEKKMLFSYSVCSERDLFNRKVAGKICKSRFDSGDFYEIVNYDPNLSAIENIESAFGNYLTYDKGSDNITSPKFGRVSARISDKEIDRALYVLETYYHQFNGEDYLDIPVLDSKATSFAQLLDLDTEDEATVNKMTPVPSLAAQLGQAELTAENKTLH